MRGPLAVLLVAGALLAGCGEGEEDEVAGAAPTVDPALTTPGDVPLPLGKPTGVRSYADGASDALDAGEPGIVGLDGVAGVRPKRIEIAEDATVERIEWTRYGAAEATGRGRMRLLECAPTCAQGVPEMRRVIVRMSEPTDCPEGTFFGRVEIQTADGQGPQPASFIQPPC